MRAREQIGVVSMLQVQRRPLKLAGSYDPAWLLQVDEAFVGPVGVLGLADGGWVVDAHHGAHPQCRGRGNRPLTIGFTAGYQRMRARYGDVAVDGIAGENIIVRSDLVPPARLLFGGLGVEDTAGRVLELQRLVPATPCAEFSSFLLGLPEPASRAAIADDLEYLDEGTRGFVAEMDAAVAPVRLRVGAAVLSAAF